MKKLFTFCAVALLSSLQVFAQTIIEEWDFKIQLNADGTAEYLEYLVKNGEATEVDIPEGFSYDDVEYAVKAIAATAFNGTNIEKVNVSENVIDKYPYSFYVKTGKVEYDVAAWSGYDYFEGDVTVPATVSFMGSTFTMQLYRLLFADCGNITSVTFAEGITEIPDEIFYTGTDNLTTVNYPSTLQKLGVQNYGEAYQPNYTTYGNALYLGIAGNPHFLLVKSIDDEITTCTIHANTKVIAAEAFRGCYDLAAITIPEGINANAIGDGAFIDCRSIVSVKVPATITVLPNDIFMGCHNLVEVELPETLTEIGDGAFAWCGFDRISIPAGVTKIGKGAFSACNNLKEITIPAGVTQIADETFSYCDGLYQVNLPENITSIGYSAFRSCENLVQFTFPNSVNYIGEFAFAGTALTKVTFPTSLTTIDKSAFDGCPFESIVIPSVEFIEDFAFENCQKLKSISLPEGLKSIGVNAFNNCINLQKVTIPASVTSLYEDRENNDPTAVFNNCFNLQYIEFAGATSASKMFYPTENHGVTIVVPAGTTQEFVDSKFTETYPNVVEVAPALVPEFYTEKYGLRFLLNHASKTATLVWGEMELAAEFITTPELHEGNITIPAKINYNGTDYTVTKIGNGALRGVYATDTLFIPETVTELGYKSLTDFHGGKLVLPKSLEFIGSLCFENNSNPINLYATVPPAVYSNSLRTGDWLSDETCISVNVPKASVETYKATEYWKDCEILVLDEFFIVTITNNIGNFTVKYLENRYQDGETAYFEVSPINDSYVFDTWNVVSGTLPEDINLKNSWLEFQVVDNVELEVILRETCEIAVVPAMKPTTCYGMSDGELELTLADDVEFQWLDFPEITEPKITEVASGYYELKFTQGACMQYKSFYVADGNAPISVSFDKITYPTCGNADGEIFLKADKETYTYSWSNGATTKDIANLAADYYEVTVTDPENGCFITDWTALDNADAPQIFVENVISTACDKAEGAITISVNKENLTFNWSNGETTQNLANLEAGVYTLTAVDEGGCQIKTRVEVPKNTFQRPEIALVTVSKQTGNNLVVWQRENTDLIKEYMIYRENEVTHNWEEAGRLPYSEISVFEDADEKADPAKGPWKYRIEATDNCGSFSGKSELNSSICVTVISSPQRDDSGNVSGYMYELTWTPYDGVDFSEYVLFQRVIINGVATDTELGTFGAEDEMRYTGAVPEEGYVYYYVGARLKEEFDPSKTVTVKAESGPFAIALSNLAEAENDYEEDGTAIKVPTLKDFNAYAQGGKIICNVEFVIFNVAGQNVTNQNGKLAAGVYLVSTVFGVKAVTVK